MRKIYKYGRGEKNYNNWAEEVLKRDNYTCQECGSNTKLVAHHIIPYNGNLESDVDINNGKTYCLTCHSKLHKKDKKMSQEFIEKQRKRMKESNPFKGKHHSEESKKKMSEKKKGKYIGKENPFYGKKLSKESIELRTFSRLTNKLINKYRYFMEEK